MNNNEIEKIAYYAMLFEYYKELLTQKQVNVFDYYYNEDYSLSEIADELKVSRNAIWDSLNKTISLLNDYESKLHLYEKGLKRKKLLELLKKNINEEDGEIINQIIDLE